MASSQHAIGLSQKNKVLYCRGIAAYEWAHQDHSCCWTALLQDKRHASTICPADLHVWHAANCLPVYGKRLSAQMCLHSSGVQMRQALCRHWPDASFSGIKLPLGRYGSHHVICISHRAAHYMADNANAAMYASKTMPPPNRAPLSSL